MEPPFASQFETSQAVLDAIARVAASATGGPIDPSLRVTMHFHPDRLLDGELVIAAMARDDVYRSQFETGTSNGGLTAHPGGDRWAWEHRIFGGAYDGASPADRPKYGALNYLRSGRGAAPRFGSSFVRLAPHTLARTTFCYPDSFYQPRHFGVAERMALIPLAESGRECVDPLDVYIEAHVHGPIRLSRDVEAVVLDPCYRGTEVEQRARSLPCAVEWHDGFRLSVEVLGRHPEYRGQHFVDLGCSLARDGWLTPRDLGVASSTGDHDPQSLKRVWHYLARFGASTEQANG